MGKILHLLTLQRLPPSWLPVPRKADFYAFIIGGTLTVILYIYSIFCIIYTVLAGLHTPFPRPVLCVFRSRTDSLLCCSSPLLFCCVSIAFLRFGLCFGHLAVAVMLFCAVFHLMSWRPFGLMYVLCPPPFVSLFLFPHINSPPHPLVLCLFPCHSAVIPRFCAGSAFPRSSGRALLFVLTITAIHWSVKPLNHPYKARPAGISNFPGRQYWIHSRIFSFFVLTTGTHLLCSSLFPS